MSKKIKPKHFYCETWKMNFWFFIGWDQGAYENYVLKKFDYKKDLTSADGNCMSVELDEFLVQCIWTRKDSDLSVLAHECVHAANNTLSLQGYKLDLNNDEAQAYLVESIFRKANRKTD